jgi:hypothetical protein
MRLRGGSDFAKDQIKEVLDINKCVSCTTPTKYPSPAFSLSFSVSPWRLEALFHARLS